MYILSTIVEAKVSWLFLIDICSLILSPVHTFIFMYSVKLSLLHVMFEIHLCIPSEVFVIILNLWLNACFAAFTTSIQW